MHKESKMIKKVITTGKFVKRFPNFASGLKDLQDVSNSSRSALHGARPEEISAIARLAANINSLRSSKEKSTLGVTPEGVDYISSSGFRFGWKVNLRDFNPEREGINLDMRGNSWLFYINHPWGKGIPEVSELRTSAREHGWLECFTDGSQRIPVLLPKLIFEWQLGEPNWKPQSGNLETGIPFEDIYWADEQQQLLAESFPESKVWSYYKRVKEMAVCVYNSPYQIGNDCLEPIACEFAIKFFGHIITGAGLCYPLKNFLDVKDTKFGGAPRAEELLQAILALEEKTRIVNS
jgi:hypothetical protein